MKAVKCPVCNGTGKLCKETSDSTDISKIEVTCHGCNGRGWVEVHDDYTPYPEPNPMPYPIPEDDWWRKIYPFHPWRTNDWECPIMKKEGFCYGNCPNCPHRTIVISYSTTWTL